MPTEYSNDTTTCPHCKKWVDLQYKTGYMVRPKLCPHCKEPMDNSNPEKVLPPQ